MISDDSVMNVVVVVLSDAGTEVNVMLSSSVQELVDRDVDDWGWLVELGDDVVVLIG